MGEPLDAKSAVRIGLIKRLEPAQRLEQLETEIQLEVPRRVASAPPFLARSPYSRRLLRTAKRAHDDLEKPISVKELSSIHVGTAVGHLGIEFQELATFHRVPVDSATRQPYGLLHGGVSVALAEILGSCGAARGVSEGWRAVAGH